MDEIFKDLKANYPSAYKLLNFSESEGLDELLEIGVPDDYVAFYNLISFESERSDGVFGLNRLLPVDSSSIVTEPEYLKSYKLDKIADLFVPIFQSPGRQQFGYAKIDGRWIFCELDLGVEPVFEKTLTEFLTVFHQKVKSNGYIEEAGLNGLIDEADM
ncbi:hypothetical protein [Agarivorans sp. 1_MG-2023]|uniref:hypothetical protein n=1 Tax=Agarivorans sp. 1_MG-2023 TaxID=3062634 RepID=UPI0026E39C92|nr:hypothetical protein [Agarivorans sp. 1_MG-2023]MDO6765948.1 hypothetical protein [Agarivorans sp. 1_MG-2023]